MTWNAVIGGAILFWCLWAVARSREIEEQPILEKYAREHEEFERNNVKIGENDWVPRKFATEAQIKAEPYWKQEAWKRVDGPWNDIYRKAS